MPNLRVILALVVALALHGCEAPSSAQTAIGPSFDCSSAKTEIEIAICNDATLAAADRLMARLYADAQESAFGRGRSNELAVQREWLGSWEINCGHSTGQGYLNCLRGRYDDRNAELAVAALFRNPELALATLRRLNPDGEPLVEAVYVYVSEPPGADWSSPSLAMKRSELLTLLEPFARSFATDDRLSYGREILKDEGIVSAEDALKTEKAFAGFLQISSAYVRDERIPPLIPCAAIVRHPKLLDATGPVFGSTLDNFVLQPDCMDTSPPTPRLSALVNQINKGWPECDGTIRFAAYRSYDREVNAARLATEDELVDAAPNGRMPRLRGVSSAVVKAAITELTDYYQRYGRATISAPMLARAMVHRILATAHECGG